MGRLIMAAVSSFQKKKKNGDWPVAHDGHYIHQLTKHILALRLFSACDTTYLSYSYLHRKKILRAS